MYNSIGAITRFGGATACYRLLRPHLKLSGGFLHLKDLHSFASQSEIMGGSQVNEVKIAFIIARKERM